MSAFRFLALTDIDPKLTPMDGMLGLGPDDPSNGPSFVAEIANQGIVTNKMFGLIMSKTGVSEITFGGYDESWMKYRGIDIDYFP